MISESTRLPRVLVASDSREWIVNVVDGYHRLGFDVITGVLNFEFEKCDVDIVHIQWPEELVNWKVPTKSQIDEIEVRLARWSKRARLIVAVQNLYPHGQHRNPLCHRLYKVCYEHAEVIQHFSQVSKELVCSEFPSVAAGNHFVRLGFNYDLLLANTTRHRLASRQSLGISPDEMTYLVFGALRTWNEVQLIRTAFDRAKVPRKRLLMAGRYTELLTSLKARYRRWRFLQWQRRRDITTPFRGFVPAADICRLFDSADCVVVIREAGLISGVPSMAMTFGRMVIAPNVGSIPEYVSGAENLLYDPESTTSLVKQLEHAAKLDREAIGAANRRIASKWNWDGIIQGCVDALSPSFEVKR